RPATDSYKVSIAYRDGFTASGTLLVFGPGEAEEKARQCGEIILQRLRRAGIELEQSLIEGLGAGAANVRMPDGSRPDEVVLRVSARDSRRDAIDRFAKEFAPLVTSG